MSEIRIENKYNFTNEEIRIINRNFSDYNDWSKDVFNDVKKNIIEHLRIEQSNKCCYCKRELGFDIKNVDIEHILPKSTFSNFTFIAKNLALSCPGCNTKKGNKNIVNYNYLRYPANSNKIKIIHAHFDDYFDHIEIYNGLIFVAKSLKGSETITACQLFRLKEVEERARQNRADTGISQIIDAIREGSPEKQEELKQALSQLISFG